MITTILRDTPAAAPTSLVVLLHGYGADGADLLDLATQWRAALPHAAFIAPNAPSPCEMNHAGFQWWSLADGLDPSRSLPRCKGVTPIINAMLQDELTRYNLPATACALVGFSQGAMLALEVGLHAATPPAAIIGYSGMLLDLDPSHITQRPPVLLVHGMMDPVVPFMVHAPTVNTLQQAGVPVTSLTRPMLTHSIDHEGIKAGGDFLRKYLP